MKTVFLCCFLALFAATIASAITLPELEKSYETRCATIVNFKRNSLKTLQRSYLAALQSIETKYQRAGKLNEVLLVKKEAKSIEDSEWPLKALPKEISLDTSAPRKIFLRKHLEIDQQAAKDLSQTADTMAKTLDAQIVSLTKSGDLAAAKLAQTIKKSLDENPEISAARKLVANVRSDGSSRPALRIRRAGDEMEVLVGYDTRGKIGLDSPVINIDEKDKAIGDTSATVLGEFIGGKGYEVDPLILFSKIFDKDDLGEISLTEIDHEFKKEIEKSSGIAFTMHEGAVNPYISLPVILPVQSVGGTTRVSFEYLIPKSNHAVTGFQLIQGFSGGNPFGEKIFSTTGKWITESAVSEPHSEETRLLLYLNINPAEKQAKLSNEPVIIREIKIEQLCFTAYIIQRLGESGTIIESYNSPTTQPKLASNGELLPE